MASELKPCPFCGSNRIAFRSTPDMDTDGKFHRISCNECGAGSREKFAMETCPLFYEELRSAWNTRPAPAATDTGLARYDLSMFGNGIVEMGGGAYVRFDQAEELLAAKDVRIKELDRCHEGTIDLCNQKTAQIEALEAKLAAAEKALGPFAAVLEDYDPDWEDDDVSAVLVVGSVTHYGITLGDFRKARAPLGGKQS